MEQVKEAGEMIGVSWSLAKEKEKMRSGDQVVNEDEFAVVE